MCNSWQPIETAPKDGTRIIVYEYWILENLNSGLSHTFDYIYWKEGEWWLVNDTTIEEDKIYKIYTEYADDIFYYWIPMPELPTESK